MAWYRLADRKPVERYRKGGSVHTPMLHPGRICLHTAVSDSRSLFPLFNTPGNAVAHFYCREDGTFEQYVGTRVRASANLDGNYDMIAVESWDDGGDRETYNNAQIDGLTHLLIWLHYRHNIPLIRLENSKPGNRGIGWHRLGIDGNFEQKPGELLGGRVPGGEEWSESRGKECPFSGKIKQIVETILPNARQIVRDREN